MEIETSQLSPVTDIVHDTNYAKISKDVRSAENGIKQLQNGGDGQSVETSAGASR